ASDVGGDAAGTAGGGGGAALLGGLGDLADVRTVALRGVLRDGDGLPRRAGAAPAAGGAADGVLSLALDRRGRGRGIQLDRGAVPLRLDRRISLAHRGGVRGAAGAPADRAGAGGDRDDGPP